MVCGVCVCVVDASEEGGYVVESITSYIRGYLVRMYDVGRETKGRNKTWMVDD